MRNLPGPLIVLLVTLIATPGMQCAEPLLANFAPSEGAQAPPTSKKQLAARFARIPLSFEVNRGQADKGVEFLSRGSGHTLFLAHGNTMLVLQRPTGSIAPRGAHDKHQPSMRGKANQTDIVELNLIGASQNLRPLPLEELPGKSNYFGGDDPKKWIVDVPHFRRIKYQNAYPGIDLVYYGAQEQLESDFVIAPGADPATIRVAVTGAESLDVGSEGDLVLRAAGGEIRLERPYLYQESSQGRRKIAGSFRPLGRNQFGFKVQGYDKSLPLVIDPVLSYSTYLGGIGDDRGTAVAVDASGNAYLAGATACCVPSTPGAFESTPDHSGSGFISKFDPTGTTLIYSTYLYTSFIRAIALDSAGNVYATGSAADGFPVTTGAFQSSAAGDVAFIAKLNPAGNELVFGTLLGPPTQVGIFAETTYGTGIAVDGTGSAYVTGPTVAPNFPTTPGAYDLTCGTDGNCNFANGGYSQDGFVTKINPSGTSLVYSTFLGGSGDDLGEGIAVDASGNAYITGATDSPDFPVTAGAFQTTPSTGIDAFLTKLNPSGTALVYSTFLAGSGDDWSYAITLDRENNAYVAGSTSSTDFPTTPGSFQPALNPSPLGGAPDAFVLKLNPTGNGLVYSTFLGGTGSDTASAIALDGAKDAFVAGSTSSADFPLQTPFQAGCFACPFGFDMSFVAELSASGSSLVYSSYLGGESGDGAAAIAVDKQGNTYVAGTAFSADFPVVNAFQSTIADYFDGNGDAFLTKISPSDSDVVFLYPPLTTFPSQPVNSTSSPMTVDVRNIGSIPLTISNVAISGDFVQTNNCGSSVPAASSCSVSTSFAPTAAGTRSGLLTITDSAPGSPHTVSLTGTGIIAPLLRLSTFNLDFGNQPAGTTSTPQTETITNGGSAPLNITNILAPGLPFQIAGSTCGSSVAAGQSCALSITFAPLQAGAFTGEIIVSSNDPTSTDLVNLTGTGTTAVQPDFSLAISPPSSTIASGASATYTLSVTPMGGWNQSVAVTCSGLPISSTCAVSPASVPLDGVNTSQAIVTITTTAYSETTSSIPVNNTTAGLLLWASAPFVFVWPKIWLRRRSLGSFPRSRVIATLTLLLSCLIGCGGSSSPPPPPVSHGTPPGTYQITITGASGSLQHTNTVTLVVQ